MEDCINKTLWSWIKQEFKLSNIMLVIGVFVMLVSFYNKSVEVSQLSYKNSQAIERLNDNKLDKAEFEKMMNITNDRLECIEAKIDKVIWEIRR